MTSALDQYDAPVTPPDATSSSSAGAVAVRGSGSSDSAAAPARRSRLQRVHGKAMVRFGPKGMQDLEQKAPARILFPNRQHPDFTLAVTVTTAGGLTGGDQLELAIVVDPHANATVVQQAAEKLYCALDDDAPTQITTTVDVGEGGACEWIAQEAILFNGSKLRRSLHVTLDKDARFLATDLVVFGRGAMGEIYADASVHDAWRIRREGRLIWADALAINGDFLTANAESFAFNGSLAAMTLVYAGADAADHLALARDVAGQFAGENCGATSFDGLLILRVCGPDPQTVRRTGFRVTEALRAAIFGLPATLPSLCYC